MTQRPDQTLIHQTPLIAGLWIICLFINIQHATATERLIWDKHPLQLSLPVGKERLVSFPHSVRVGLPASLTGKLTTQSLNGTVYWTATQVFQDIRVQIQSTDGSQLYLMDVTASNESDTRDVEILLPATNATQTQIALVSQPAQTTRSLDYIILTRFAAQQLYAPERLLHTPPLVQRSRIQQQPTRHLIRAARIEATPIAAWRKGRLYVTAIRLQNQTQTPINLNPEQIRGRWHAATFQHGILKAQGSPEDTTALYLISDRPFGSGL